MKNLFLAMALLGAAVPASAQQPDTAQLRRDSIELVKELERQRADTQPARMTPRPPQAAPRLIPDISAISDFVVDLSPEGSTQEEGDRMTMRELEIALGANVDPYFRADFILGISGHEGISIEEGYATALALPANLQARVGRFHMPFGKQNTTHRAELHTLEYPWVIQRFLGDHALKGTGVWVSKIFAPFGFYQELLVTAVELVPGHEEEELVTEEPLTKGFRFNYSARLRNYLDLSESANVELSASALMGPRRQAYEFGFAPDAEVNAIAADQAHFGGDLTFRWRPLQQGLYRSFIANAEFIYQANARDPDPNYLGPSRDFRGAYGFARWQLTRRTYVGARYDWLEDPEEDGRTFKAASGYFQWFPSEFSKVNLAFERTMPRIAPSVNRILVQAVFAIGPHRPHPF